MKQIAVTLGFLFGLHAVLVTATAAGANLGEPERRAAVPVPTPPLSTNSPAQIFRRLLAFSPQERAQFLAAKTPEVRKVLEAKLSEFEPLSPAHRELRLRQLQLRWYLVQLRQMQPSNRVARLALIAQEDRKLVEDRLTIWDGMTPELRQEVLENEVVLEYIFTLESSTPAQRETILRGLSRQQREKLDKDIARLQAVPPEQRDNMYNRFQQFFDLNDREKERILASAGQSQQEQLAKTLRAFQQLPKPQRDLCMEGLSKFTQLTSEERLQFLQNCERWQAMTTEQQNALRSIITRVAPQPPTPPQPKGLPGYPTFYPRLKAYSVAATNY